MRIRILRSALEDLATAREFYDSQSDGIGDYFFDSLFSEIDSLTLYAGIHPMRFGYHRMVVQRFPYCIYYRVSDEEATVFRVLDARRNPSWIRRSLSEQR
jgi:plasmid stabilization system protein ParE